MKKTTTDAVTDQANKTTTDIIISDLLFDWGSTQEYLLATIAHELLHAFINYNNITLGNAAFPTTEKEQHEYIATNYLDDIAGLIQAYNPDFTSEEAKALAWGGLEDTQAYQDQVVKTGKEKKISEIQEKERKDLVKGSQKGTNCP